MFVFTAKFSRKKAVLAVLLLAAALVAIILIAGRLSRDNTKQTASLSAVVKNNEQRVNYLKALGWDVEKTPVEEQKVVIPRNFTDVYKRYNELQLSQGFDLSKYGGVEATRYTYRVLNYPGAAGSVYADIIVYRNEVIAGDIQSNALDGFMVGLEYPKTSPSPPASPASPAGAAGQAGDGNASADTAAGQPGAPAEAGAKAQEEDLALSENAP